MFAAALLTGALWFNAPGYAQNPDPEAAPPPPPPADSNQEPAPAPAPGRWRRFSETRPPSTPRYTPPPAPSYYPPPQLLVPAGTWVTIRLNEPLSSSTAVQGQAFNGTLAKPIVVNGYVVARAGQMVGGRVTEVQRGRSSRLGIELTEIGLVDGQQIQISSTLTNFVAGSNAGRNAAIIGTTTGVGAAIGAAADGGFGAGMGAIAGAAASTIGVLVAPGRATEVYPESMLTFKTMEPVTVSTLQSPQAFQPVRQQDYQQHQLQQRRVVAPAPVYGGWGYGYPYAYAYPYPYPYYYPGYWGWGPTIGIGIYRGHYGRHW